MKCPECGKAVKDVHFTYIDKRTQSESDSAQMKPCAHSLTRSDNQTIFTALERMKGKKAQRQTSQIRSKGRRR